MSTQPNAPVLIAGAGIGGLATALALAQRGSASVLIERRAEPPEAGAGIQIGPNGVRILRALGVADALTPHVAVPQSITILDGVTGTALASVPLGGTIETRHGAPYWTAHRADLFRALHTAVQAQPLITLKVGREVTSFSNSRDAAFAETKDGATVEGRALIIADGLWSNLRESVAPGAQLSFSGKVAYRAIIPVSKMPAELRANSTHVWLASTGHVVHYPVRAGAEVAIVAVIKGHAMPPGWGEDTSAGTVSRVFPHAPPALSALLAAADTWRCWPLMTLPALPSWVSGRTVLLGDAAHPVLPFLAQGAVLALEDATVLAQALGDPALGVEDALRDYETARRPRAQRVADASKRNGDLYHLPWPISAARNAVVRSRTPQSLLSAYDWLYGWTSD